VTVTCDYGPNEIHGWTYPGNDPLTGGFGTCVDNVPCPNLGVLNPDMTSGDYSESKTYVSNENFTYVKLDLH
jgi:hypothetical protein